MDKSPAKPETPARFHPIFPFIAIAWRSFSSCLVLAAAMLPHLALAQQTPNTNTGIIDQLRQELGPILTIGLQLLLIGGFATAAYIVITGAIRVMQDREGGLARFGLGVLVAIAMIAFTVYLVGQGSTAVGVITSGTGGTGN